MSQQNPTELEKMFLDRFYGAIMSTKHLEPQRTYATEEDTSANFDSLCFKFKANIPHLLVIADAIARHYSYMGHSLVISGNSSTGKIEGVFNRYAEGPNQRAYGAIITDHNDDTIFNFVIFPRCNKYEK